MKLFTSEQAILLALLKEKLAPGDIKERIQAITGETPSDGALYAALRVSMEKEFVVRHGGDRYVDYELTSNGREKIQEFAKQVARFLER